MNAFETELGLMNELARVVDDQGWLLPTDIQSEAIPLILGGGDVLMAAETGSGKTGAFCLPVLQIVYESLCENSKSKMVSNDYKKLTTKLSVYDKSNDLSIDITASGRGLLCQSCNPKIWVGCRASRGVKNGAKAYFECILKNEGICRFGWSLSSASYELGTDADGFGFGGTGKKSFKKQFDSYGEPFTMGDTIGCYIDLSKGNIFWSKNGKNLGIGYHIPSNMLNKTFYPSVCIKNSTVLTNFGSSEDNNVDNGNNILPEAGFSFIDHLTEEYIEESLFNFADKAAKKQKTQDIQRLNAPLCIVIEPSRELAEQTLQQFQRFKSYLTGVGSGQPQITELLLIGGVPVRAQLEQLKSSGAHIIVATPGRLEDFISQKEIELDMVRFFVLDELDGLLKSGCKDMIERIHRSIPQYTSKGRLQMIVCSATLHNFDVKKLAERIMNFPSWIDLKGQDSVPETVHHCVCYVDPVKDTSWRKLPRNLFAEDDGVHKADNLNIHSGQCKETMSEAVKLLKPLYVKYAVEKFKMDRCLIFCRTKLDCDNLERYFQRLGGGPQAPASHQFSCVCLHGDRNPGERKANLQVFKSSKVRLMICTDVAARGIDIAGLPYIINVTLPDDKSNYIHRIGRVGRAERMGLAISFCSTVQEKVWYHTCPNRGKGCYNTRLTTDHGCCMWYGEKMYLAEIEENLGETISVVDPSLNIPVDEFQGKVVYGHKLTSKNKSNYEDHVESLAPTVKELSQLEFKSQSLYLELKQMVH
ncbi:hypothetical protein GJ496_005693 [Pomphorhynchus laevis]|nr:hypothetical protein GJ496_005693 [Pomphorhynchus laevis]